MNSLPAYLACLASALVVLYGDYLLKSAVERGLPAVSPMLLLAAGLYGASAFGWFYAMRSISLTQIGVAFSIFTILALVAMDLFIFGEKLVPREYLGVALAIASMLLMTRIA